MDYIFVKHSLRQTFYYKRKERKESLPRMVQTGTVLQQEMKWSVHYNNFTDTTIMIYNTMPS